MKWSQYTIVAHAHRPTFETVSKQIRAVSQQHAVEVAQRTYTAANGFSEWSAEKCRCSEINNDMCTACYTWWNLKGVTA